MPITHVAEHYLRTYESGMEFDGGMSFRAAVDDLHLDYSEKSLQRIDDLLDRIREQIKPQPDVFVADQANVNFLYFLAFYVGRVVTLTSGATIAWYSYDEMIALMPENQTFFPRCFGTSVTCVLSGGTKGGFYVPLAAMETRLYEDVPDKSVRVSAGTFM